MPIPIASTITLIMELIIASIIFFIIFKGFAKNIFLKKLSYFAIGYEIIFNVSYMLYRTIASQPSTQLSNSLKIFAALHGSLSLIILVAVIWLFLKAGKAYAKNINYFKVHKIQTFLFILCWVISILSGIFLSQS